MYFYPRDNTPGCTTEACDFRDRIKAFESEKTVVLGVSGDTLESHAKFRAKYKLPFPLLTDPDYKISTLYGAFGDKKLYGKSLKGVIRSTYVIGKTDSEGRCEADIPANPDNIMNLNDGTLLIGEDAGKKRHDVDMLWMVKG